ncbi:MAG: tRNA (adenosine(37)-N6)-dimethylallyltransferase MiaA [Clostridia bacterium]|nr:tRNA (adenosine(37)-N6)-dimethylallyltransferase MiaA [Clostridia bacterium]
MENTTQNRIKILAVVGPTASGKTSLGVSLAKKLDGEIVSADSIQIYKDMQIASAKPTDEEKCGVPHHMMDFVPTDESYNVSKYVMQAHDVIADITRRGKLPIIVGGTGLYIDSLLNDIEFAEENDNTIRMKLEQRLKSEGIETLYSELIKIDPECASIHINNQKRVLRALEIYYATGKTPTENKIISRSKPSRYDATFIGLKCNNREVLYNRINLRVDQMLKEGLLKETRHILSKSLSDTARAAIGYKELEPFINGEISLEDAIENLKRETRRYAKRQLTWFLRNKEINWINTDEYNDTSYILDKAFDICERSGLLRLRKSYNDLA